jgi:hypothetical protein
VQALASVTTTQVSGTANPSPPGDSVTLIAKVTTRTAPVTVGMVMFKQGGRTLGTVPLAGDGTASLPVPGGLPIGNDPITATYSGYKNFTTNDLGSSGSFVETINPYDTRTTLSSSANPGNPGSPVTFTATVVPTGGPMPRGSVTFSVAGVAVRTVALDGSGTASYTTSSLPPGSTAITAVFSDNTGTDQSSSASVTEAVNPYTTVVTLTLVPFKPRHGKRVYQLRAVVTTTGAGGAAPLPTGTVAFRLKGTSLGSVPLQGGVAVLSVGRTRPRHKSFTATFAGTAAFAGSTQTQVL